MVDNICKVNLDLVALIHDSEMMKTEELVKSGEPNFRGDRETGHDRQYKFNACLLFEGRPY